MQCPNFFKIFNMGKTKKSKKDQESQKKRHKEKKSKKKKIKADKHIQNIKEAPKTDKNTASSYDIPVDLMNRKSFAPETPQEYQQRQSQIRHETDPITGRRRLVKGDGEILEEIVSRKRHLQINKLATESDGNFFQNKVKTKRD